MTKYVDFDAVEAKHQTIHKRLANWASWVSVRHINQWAASSLWLQVKSNAWQWHPPEYRETCDIIDAQYLEKEICKLPRPHADALRWCYVFRTSPGFMASKMGVNKSGLARLIRDGRQMLMNRIEEPDRRSTLA